MHSKTRQFVLAIGFMIYTGVEVFALLVGFRYVSVLPWAIGVSTSLSFWLGYVIELLMGRNPWGNEYPIIRGFFYFFPVGFAVIGSFGPRVFPIISIVLYLLLIRYAAQTIRNKSRQML